MFTDIFIRRPVLASVVSILILLIGARAYYALPVENFSTTTGQLSGTPTASLGSTVFTVTVTDQTTPTAQTASRTFSLTVNAGNQTISFAPLANASLSASPLTLTASASSGLAVSFTSATTGVCTVSGTTLMLVTTGTCTINADQAGNANYTAAPQVSRSFTVTPATLVATQAVANVTATMNSAGSTRKTRNNASAGAADGGTKGKRLAAIAFPRQCRDCRTRPDAKSTRLTERSDRTARRRPGRADCAETVII